MPRSARSENAGRSTAGRRATYTSGAFTPSPRSRVIPGQTRAAEAAARIFWPLGDSGLGKRLGLITAPTLLLWGEQDKVMPLGYADTIKAALAGPCETRLIAGAGHLAELDKPDEVAAAILDWMA